MPLVETIQNLGTMPFFLLLSFVPFNGMAEPLLLLMHIPHGIADSSKFTWIEFHEKAQSGVRTYVTHDKVVRNTWDFFVINWSNTNTFQVHEAYFILKSTETQAVHL